MARICSLRAYAATKQAIDSAERQDDVPEGPMKGVWLQVVAQKGLERRGGEQE